MNLGWWFLSTQALIALSFILVAALNRKGTQAQKLKFHYGALVILVSAVLLQAIIPISTSFRPLQKYWVGARTELSQSRTPASAPVLQTQVPAPEQTSRLPEIPHLTLLALFLTVMAFAFLKLKKDFKTLAHLREKSFRVKKIGRLEILANDDVAIPFSFWTWNASVVIVPSALLSDRIDYRISVLHEIQHHRQRDPQWMVALELFKWIGYLNPFTKLWIKNITELQEFACDETLIGRSKVTSRQYARCLFKAAETALNSEFKPPCATGFLFRVKRHQLKRRITMFLSQNQTQLRTRSKLWTQWLMLALITSGFALATKAIAQTENDRTLTANDAQKMMSTVKNADGFPVAINELVVKELNLLLGSPARRQTTRDALNRMKTTYQGPVDQMLIKYKLPVALDAMPMVESGYQNLPAREPASKHPAGLWQFISPTAKHYGIKVTDEQDGRMDVSKLNEAAGKMMKKNVDQYQDVGLSVLAFNWGETKLDQVIAQAHSKDAWALVKANRNDTYLPKVVAAMLVIANPESLN